jgi:hypothetical protein
MPQEVHEIDSEILSLELRAYMPVQPEHLLPKLPPNGSVGDLPTKTLLPRMAEKKFLKEAMKLGIA